MKLGACARLHLLGAKWGEELRYEGKSDNSYDFQSIKRPFTLN
jgi:hypothetical protein